MKLHLNLPFTRASVSSAEVGDFGGQKKKLESKGNGDVLAPSSGSGSAGSSGASGSSGADAPWLLPNPPGSQIEPLISLPALSREAPSKDRFPDAQGVLQGLWSRAVDVVKNSSATREVARARKIRDEVNALAPEMRALSDEQLK